MEELTENKKSNRVYGHPDKYITTESIPTPLPLTEEEIRKQNARRRLEERLAKNEVVQTKTKKLKLKNHIGKIVGAALIVAATLSGTVAAIQIQDTLTNEEPNIEMEVEQESIIPTQAELEAGLTLEQIKAKRNIDADENAMLQAMVNESQNQTTEKNNNLDETINSRTR